MRVLLLTVSAGGGHLVAAESVKNYVEANYPGSKCYIVDAYKYASPIIDKVVIGGYLKTLKNSPKLWGKLYELAEKEDNVNDLSQTLNKILSYKIKTLVRDFKPDVVVCTHPFPLQMACNLKKTHKMNIPIVNVITDYGCHSFWVNEYVDAYIVSHEGVVYELTERGVSKEKIYPFGIPINSKFKEVRGKNEILSEYKLQDKTTLLVMGGFLGMGEIKKLFIKLLESPRDFQLIVVCGKNAKLKKQLEKIHAKSMSPRRVIILGFVTNVNELMSISSMTFTKPGGLTITEAMMMNLPMVIMTPIPGQEARNSDFLLNNGLGVRLHDVNEVERVVWQCFDNPLRIRHIKEMSEYFSKPDATENAAHLLNQLSSNVLK